MNYFPHFSSIWGTYQTAFQLRNEYAANMAAPVPPLNESYFFVEVCCEQIFFPRFFVDSTWVSTNLYQRVYYKPLHADRKQERSVIQGGLNQAEISRKCNETLCGPLDAVSISDAGKSKD